MYAKMYAKRAFCLLVTLILLFTNNSAMSVFAENTSAETNAASTESETLTATRSTASLGMSVSANSISENAPRDVQPEPLTQEGTGSLDLKAGAGDRDIYYDATFSKVNYRDANSSNNAQNSIPLADDKVYYYAWSSSNSSSVASGAMTHTDSLTKGSNTYKDVWKVTISSEYDKIRFANTSSLSDPTNGNNTAGAGGIATGILDIPSDASKSCFYADNGDQSVYSTAPSGVSSPYFRGGEWKEPYVNTSRGNGITHHVSGTEVHDSKTLYVNTTFYDYYSDLEINGFDRTRLSAASTSGTPDLGYSNRTYMTHRLFNMALSDYYSSKSVNNPLYFGHVQWSNNNEGTYFNNISRDLGLYGYDVNSKANNYHFLHINNSEFRENCETCANKYQTEAYQNHSHETSVATQGLVANSLAGKDTLQLQSGVDAPFFNKSFLEGANSYNTAL